MAKDNYTDLLEDINSKFDRVIEAVDQVRQDVRATAKQSDLEDVKSDVKVVKAAVTDVSTQVNKHDQRLSNLEASS